MRLLKKALLFTVWFCAGVSQVWAQTKETAPEVFLNRLSQRLVGGFPMPEEYIRLKAEMQKRNCNSTSCLEDYYRKYIQDKMKSEEFYVLFYSHITERFGYKSPKSLSVESLLNTRYPDNGTSAPRDFGLVYKILKENRSFDELYTSQIIVEPDVNSNLNKSSGPIEYIGIDTDGLKKDVSNTNSFNFELNNKKTLTAKEFDLSGHHNYSGLFSSTVFLNHRWNTDLNQNRKRSAAFYRIMICDSMTPALDRETEKQRENRMARGLFDEDVITANLKQVHLNRHATQADCASCHKKLDPVGKVFRSFEQGISNVPLKGALLFSDASESLNKMNVDDFHDLTTKTVKLDRYFDCQLSWFLEILLGQDFKASTGRLIELTRQIENRKRKIRDVIEEVLMIPEFRNISLNVTEPESLKQAKLVFENCKECHSSFFSMRPELLKSKLGRIAICMDLANDGRNRQMPPSDHYWHPGQDEIQQINSWIRQGAPITEKDKLLSPEDVQKLFNYESEGKKCRR